MNTLVQFIGDINFSKDTSHNTLTILTTIIPMITSLYFVLIFLFNEDIEKKLVRIVGYSRKWLNIYCIFFILAYCMLPFICYFLNASNIILISASGCIIYLIVYFVLYFKDQENETFFYFVVKPFIISSIQISIGSKFLRSFGTKELKFCFWGLYILFGILYIHTTLNKFKVVYGVKISFKNDGFNNYEQDKLGFILFETNDDIIFEINGILNRYRKSDIFCIEEVKDSYKSNLDKIEKGINKFKNNKNIQKLIKNEIYFIEKEFLKLQKISYLYNINRNKYMEYINSINTLIHLLNLIKKNVKIESYIKNDEIIKNDYENIKSELFKLKTFINN